MELQKIFAVAEGQKMNRETSVNREWKLASSGDEFIIKTVDGQFFIADFPLEERWPASQFVRDHNAALHHQSALERVDTILESALPYVRGQDALAEERIHKARAAIEDELTS